MIARRWHAGAIVRGQHFGWVLAQDLVHLLDTAGITTAAPGSRRVLML